MAKHYNEYADWLKKQIAIAMKKSDDNWDNYQETGSPRYEKAHRHYDYLQQALVAAQKIENGESPDFERYRRIIKSLRTETEKLPDTATKDDFQKLVLSYFYK